MKHKVEYKINSNGIPTVTLDGETLGVVTCSYQWVTSGIDSIGSCVFVASCVTVTGNEVVYDISVNEKTGETFVQKYEHII